MIPIDNGKNIVSNVSRLFLIRSFSWLQVLLTIKVSLSTKGGQMEQLTTELAAHERLISIILQFLDYF